MIAFTCFLAGLMLGGCVALGFLCAFQLKRIDRYEEKINALEQKLNNQ